MKRILAVMICLFLILGAVGMAYGTVYNFASLRGMVPDKSIAYDINNDGTIVGVYGPWTEDYGFSLNGSTFTHIVYPGNDNSNVFGINNNGTIVGVYWPMDNTQGFLLTGTSYSPLDYVAFGINDLGTMVGPNLDEGDRWGGFILSGTTLTRIYYPGARYTNPWAINNNGTVVGDFRYDDGSTHGFMFNGTTYTPIDYPGALWTVARDINNYGTIVGSYSDETGNHGFTLNGTTYTSLEYPGTPYGSEVYGINDLGQIVGQYFEETGQYGFLATPVPIPGDFAPGDCDVDGTDLAVLIANPGLLDLSTFAQNFGKKVCT
jgi:probable HAF family extracellular repeat protein